jgi:hypothetical protein
MKISRSLFCLAKDLFFALILSTGLISFSQMAFAQTPGGVSAGLKLWLKADAGIALADGTKISSWPDQTAAGYNLTRAGILPAANHHDQTIKWIVP